MTPSLSSLMPATTSTTTASFPETSCTLAFLFLIPPPFTYLKDSRTSAITPTTPTVISPSSTLTCKSISHPWPLQRKKLLYPPDEQLTSLARSSSYAVREVIKNTGHQKLVHTFDRFHAHTWTKQKFIVISVHSHHHLRSPLRLSFFWCQKHHAEQNATPKSNFGVHTGTHFQSSRALHLMSHCPWFTPLSHCSGGFTRSLVYPYHAILCQSLPHPQTKLGSQNDISYFYATASRSSTQSSGGWANQDLNLHVVTQTLSKRRMTLVKTTLWFCWTCSSINACLDRGGRKTRWFLMLLHVKYLFHITLWKIITGGWLGYRIGLNQRIHCWIR